MQPQPGPEGARWQIPDWDPAGGSSEHTPYLDQISKLEKELAETKAQLEKKGNGQISITSEIEAKEEGDENSSAITDKNIEAPKPKTNSLYVVVNSVPIFQEKWKHLAETCRYHESWLDSESGVKKPNLTGQQIQEIRSHGFTYLTLGQVEFLCRNQSGIVYSTKEWLTFEASGVFSFDDLCDAELQELRSIPVFDKVLRRRIRKRALKELLFSRVAGLVIGLIVLFVLYRFLLKPNL